MNLNAIIADTGPLYAAIDPNDQYHQRARTELETINQQQLSVLIPYPVYLETHKLALHWLGVQPALQFAENIKQTANLINPTSEDYETALAVLTQFPDQDITLCDAVTSILAHQLQLPIWTYDHHFDIIQAQVWRP